MICRESLTLKNPMSLLESKMFRAFFLGILWTLSLCGLVASAFHSTRLMFVGSPFELAISLSITFLAMGGFVSIDNQIKRDPI